MEYYSALEKKAVLSHGKTWMDPEDTMPSEISWSQKDKHCMSPLNMRYLEQTSSWKEKWGVSRDWEGGKTGSYYLMDMVSVFQDADLLEMGCITHEST